MNIVEFIEARIAEDEQIAQAARPGPWIDERGTRIGPKIGDEYLMVPESQLANCEDYIPEDDATHIARHDPARVLLECVAKRAILGIHTPVAGGRACKGCGTVGVCDDWVAEDVNDCPILRAVAAIWSDHPDYQAGWESQ